MIKWGKNGRIDWDYLLQKCALVFKKLNYMDTYNHSLE